MELKCKINGEEVTLRAEPTARLRDVLYRAGYRSVRDSDDAEGFAGSDTIVFNGKLKYANFILFYQAEGAEIRTAESLLNGRELNNVQKAMVAAGIVQSAYNAPAAALILTWLLEQQPNPTREEIKDVLTSIFIRDAGYEHYYLAVKLATELSKRSTGRTIYILDEPTTGLHTDDVKKLLEVLQRLVDAGNTVLVIEHNLDVIKCADYLLDLGPEGGSGGGTIVATGTPEQVAQNPNSFTGQYLKPVLERAWKLQGTAPAPVPEEPGRPAPAEEKASAQPPRKRKKTDKK